MRIQLFFLALVLGLSAGTAAAQDVVTASPDVAISLGGVLATDEDAAIDNQLGLVVLEDLGALPAASDVVGLASDAAGHPIVVLDTAATLSGTTWRAGTALVYSGGTYTSLFEPAAAGVPDGVVTDAVSLSPNGLLLSFDTTVDLGGGLIAADEDLVEWDGLSFVHAFDGSTAGIPTALDVDGVQDQGGGVLLLSFDTTGAVGGVVFADEDIARYDGTDWTMAFDASAADPQWAAADMDGILVPEPAFGLSLVLGLAALVGGARRRAD